MPFWYVPVALVLSRGPVLAWLKAKSFVIDKGPAAWCCWGWRSKVVI